MAFRLHIPNTYVSSSLTHSPENGLVDGAVLGGPGHGWGGRSPPRDETALSAVGEGRGGRVNHRKRDQEGARRMGDRSNHGHLREVGILKENTVSVR